MGQALAEAYPEAANVFETADVCVGPISKLAFEGPEDELNQTTNSQPAILATSIAYVWALEKRVGFMPQADFYAGHSMGQYSAMVVAGVLSLEDGVRLVRERGRQMQASAAEGAMAAVVGLAEDRVSELESAGQSVGTFTLANRYSPGTTVVSGERAAIEVAMEKAKVL